MCNMSPTTMYPWLHSTSVWYYWYYRNCKHSSHRKHYAHKGNVAVYTTSFVQPIRWICRLSKDTCIPTNTAVYVVYPQLHQLCPRTHLYIPMQSCVSIATCYVLTNTTCISCFVDVPIWKLHCSFCFLVGTKNQTQQQIKGKKVQIETKLNGRLSWYLTIEIHRNNISPP